MAQKKAKIPISKKIEENEELLKKRLGIGETFDVGVRKLLLLKTKVQLYYCNGLCDTTYIIQIMREFMLMNNQHKSPHSVKEVIHNHITHEQVELTDNMDEAVDRLLSGLILIFVDGEDEVFIVDVRSYPGRNPEEPDTEKVVRGSRDGYTENIIINTALTRRRLRDERLRNEIVQVGERSKTDICISYLKDVADPGLIKLIKKEISTISIDGIPMADKTIEEYLVKQGFNPFPMARYTERPDVAVQHLLEGHVLVMVDTSPSVLITPTTYFHHVQHAEEFRQTPLTGAFERWFRFIGILAAIMLVPLWYLYVQDPHLLPKGLEFIGPNKHGHLPIFLQLLLAEVGIHLLRLAAIHTPNALATSMGLVAAVLIGQIAISVGVFVPEVILYSSVSAIGTFVTPSVELGLANDLFRILLLLLVAIFHVPGYVIGLTLFIIFIANMKNLNTPYLWPFMPFNAKALLTIIMRVAVPMTKMRPSILHPQNPKRTSN
ncbi:spore germination protein [Fictibacillus sp. Mic-4]|uniref:spore germination protein n=1 Tax=Fictibacillus TaxID=1329200 RepID=UPI000425D0FE|nr:spore germination protein [Fictibacillus gelatini]